MSVSLRKWGQVSVITVKEVSAKECRLLHSHLYSLSPCQSICLCASKPWQTQFTKGTRVTCFQWGKAMREIWHVDQPCAVIHHLPLLCNMDFFFSKNKKILIKKISKGPSYGQLSRVTAQSQSHCICLSSWLEFHFKCQVKSYFPEQNSEREKKKVEETSVEQEKREISWHAVFYKLEAIKLMKSFQ